MLEIKRTKYDEIIDQLYKQQSSLEDTIYRPRMLRAKLRFPPGTVFINKDGRRLKLVDIELAQGLAASIAHLLRSSLLPLSYVSEKPVRFNREL